MRFFVLVAATLAGIAGFAEAGQPTQKELGIRPDFDMDISESTCDVCLRTFFTIQASKYPLQSLLRHRCPVMRLPRQADVCNRLVHFHLMNGATPGAKACVAVKYCDRKTLRSMRKSGALKKLDNLAGYGKNRLGKLGVWGGFRLSMDGDGDDGDAVECLARCKKVALLARMRFNLRGLHGLSVLEDKACPNVQGEMGREVCQLVINYVRLNGAAETPERICGNVSACSFHVTDKLENNADNDKVSHA